MFVRRIAQATAIAAILSGCGMAQYEDVGNDPKYHQLIGQRLEAASKLYLHAVTLDRNYAKQVDTCSITEPPGFSGPEVIYSRTIPKGAIFEIVGVRKCINCAEDMVEMLVRSGSTATCGTAPVTIDHGLLGTGVHLIQDGHTGTPNNSFKPNPLRGSA